MIVPRGPPAVGPQPSAAGTPPATGLGWCDVPSSSQPDSQQPGPRELNTSNHGPSLEVSKDRLTVRYTGEGRHNNDVGAIQGNRPIPTQQMLYYFEVTVLDQGDLSRMAIGFTDKNFKLTRQIGWEASSWGYHSSDGRKYHATEKGEDYGPSFGTGDTVGAGIHLGKKELFFTKNGTKLRTAYKGVKGPLLPTVGLHSKGACVEVNFGNKPFRFDVEGLITDEREQQLAQVQSISLPAGATHEIVRTYLLHYGYADALQAFDQAAGLAGVEQPMSVGDDPETVTLPLRKEARQRVMSGDIDGAATLLAQQCPQLLSSGSSAAEEVQFHLACQTYIELVRHQRIDAAVTYAHTVLSKLKLSRAAWEANLKDVVALIAYQDPYDSPLSHLMGNAQREKVADAINAAVLSAATTGASTGNKTSSGGQSAGHSTSTTSSISAPQPRSVLERLLQQLVVVNNTLLEDNQGEVFKLEQHLLR